MTRPLTVLMPTLNAESFLLPALDSLAGQTFQDFDVLVVDAGSTDRTLELVQDYSQIRVKLRVNVVRCGRVGLGAQLRLGLDLIESKYVARMDADDVSEPGRFEAQIGTLENRSELSMVGSQIGLLIGNKSCRAGALPQRHEV